MSQTNPQTGVPQAPKAVPLKKKYKLAGMVGSVVIMWLDYVLIYNGLVSGDMAVVSFGMIAMVAGAAAAYYFG